MSDTTTCPNCSAPLPSGASFCTSCGTRAEAAAPPPPPPDATRVDDPGLSDATQMYAPVTPAPAAPPWQPADAPAAPAPPAWSAPAAPAAPAPPAWNQPAEPAAAPWGAPGVPTAPQPAWGAQAAAPPTTWTPPPAAAPSSPSSGGSPLGAIATLVGGALVVLGLFSAWLGTSGGGPTVTGWKLAADDSGFETKDPYALLALGIIAVLIGVVLFTGKGRPLVRIAALIVGIAVIGIHVKDWMDIADIAKALPKGVEIQAKVGFYLGIAGGALTAIAALLPAKKSCAALDGLGVLVTGGGSGIGLASAARLAADGAVVTICGRTEAKLADAVATITGAHPDADVAYAVADVTDEAAVRAAIGLASERAGGRLDAVVASAGGSESIGPVTQLDVEPWERTLALNLTGTMLALKHGAAAMVRGGGGSFVAISSIASHLSHPWFGAYGPSKAGIDQLCRQAADELGASNVRVNSVCPGLIRTELVSFITEGGPVLDSYSENTPINRIGEATDVANLVRFLVGPESTWITGQCISVDGGHGLRRGPSLASAIEPLFGADGLRGVVSEA